MSGPPSIYIKPSSAGYRQQAVPENAVIIPDTSIVISGTTSTYVPYNNTFAYKSERDYYQAGPVNPTNPNPNFWVGLTPDPRAASEVFADTAAYTEWGALMNRTDQWVVEADPNKAAIYLDVETENAPRRVLSTTPFHLPTRPCLVYSTTSSASTIDTSSPYGFGNTSVSADTSDVNIGDLTMTTWRNGSTAASFLGGSAFFSGTSCLTFGPSDQMSMEAGPFTFETWVNLSEGNSGFQTFIRTAPSSGSPTIFFGVNNGKVGYYSTAIAETDTAIEVGVWTHVAVTRDDAGTITLWVNGVPNTNTASDTTTYSNQAVSIGGTLLFTGQQLNGYMTNVRIVKGTAVYTSAFTPSTAPLTAISGCELLLLQKCSVDLLVDSSINGFTMTNNDGVAFSSLTPIMKNVYDFIAVNTTTGSAFFSGGTTSFLSVGPSEQTSMEAGPFTFETWVNLSEDNSGFQTFIRTAPSSGSPTIFFGVNNGKVGYYSTAIAETDTAIEVGVWTHVAVTRDDAGTITLWVNGVPNMNTASDTTTYSNQAVSIGGTLLFTGQQLNGYMTNVRIVKGKAVYTSAFTPSTAPLTAVAGCQLLLLASSESLLVDASPNRFTLLNNGGVVWDAGSPITPAFPGWSASSVSSAGVAYSFTPANDPLYGQAVMMSVGNNLGAPIPGGSNFNYANPAFVIVSPLKGSADPEHPEDKTALRLYTILKQQEGVRPSVGASNLGQYISPFKAASGTWKVRMRVPQRDAIIGSASFAVRKKNLMTAYGGASPFPQTPAELKITPWSDFEANGGAMPGLVTAIWPFSYVPNIPNTVYNSTLFQGPGDIVFEIDASEYVFNNGGGPAVDKAPAPPLLQLSMANTGQSYTLTLAAYNQYGYVDVSAGRTFTYTYTPGSSIWVTSDTTSSSTPSWWSGGDFPRIRPVTTNAVVVGGGPWNYALGDIRDGTWETNNVYTAHDISNPLPTTKASSCAPDLFEAVSRSGTADVSLQLPYGATATSSITSYVPSFNGGPFDPFAGCTVAATEADWNANTAYVDTAAAAFDPTWMSNSGQSNSVAPMTACNWLQPYLDPSLNSALYRLPSSETTAAELLTWSSTGFLGTTPGSCITLTSRVPQLAKQFANPEIDIEMPSNSPQTSLVKTHITDSKLIPGYRVQISGVWCYFEASQMDANNRATVKVTNNGITTTEYPVLIPQVCVGEPSKYKITLGTPSAAVPGAFNCTIYGAVQDVSIGQNIAYPTQTYISMSAYITRVDITNGDASDKIVTQFVKAGDFTLVYNSNSEETTWTWTMPVVTRPSAWDASTTEQTAWLPSTIVIVLSQLFEQLLPLPTTTWPADYTHYLANQAYLNIPIANIISFTIDNTRSFPTGLTVATVAEYVNKYETANLNCYRWTNNVGTGTYCNAWIENFETVDGVSKRVPLIGGDNNFHDYSIQIDSAAGQAIMSVDGKQYCHNAFTPGTATRLWVQNLTKDTWGGDNPVGGWVGVMTHPDDFAVPFTEKNGGGQYACIDIASVSFIPDPKPSDFSMADPLDQQRPAYSAETPNAAANSIRYDGLSSYVPLPANQASITQSAVIPLFQYAPVAPYTNPVPLLPADTTDVVWASFAKSTTGSGSSTTTRNDAVLNYDFVTLDYRDDAFICSPPISEYTFSSDFPPSLAMLDGQTVTGSFNLQAAQSSSDPTLISVSAYGLETFGLTNGLILLNSFFNGPDKPYPAYWFALYQPLELDAWALVNNAEKGPTYYYLQNVAGVVATTDELLKMCVAVCSSNLQPAPPPDTVIVNVNVPPNYFYYPFQSNGKAPVNAPPYQGGLPTTFYWNPTPEPAQRSWGSITSNVWIYPGVVSTPQSTSALLSSNASPWLLQLNTTLPVLLYVCLDVLGNPMNQSFPGNGTQDPNLSKYSQVWWWPAVTPSVADDTALTPSGTLSLPLQQGSVCYGIAITVQFPFIVTGLKRSNTGAGDYYVWIIDVQLNKPVIAPLHLTNGEVATSPTFALQNTNPAMYPILQPGRPYLLCTNSVATNDVVWFQNAMYNTSPAAQATPPVRVCGWGSTNGSFVDPANPPLIDGTQTTYTGAATSYVGSVPACCSLVGQFVKRSAGNEPASMATTAYNTFGWIPAWNADPLFIE